MISVVIASYNRYNSLCQLIGQIKELNNGVISEIIVIDSTDKEEYRAISLSRVRQIHSPYKNALFQRYIGWKTAKSPWLLYFDDDMEIINDDCFSILESIIVNEPDTHGFGLAFTNKHDNSVISNLPKSVTSRVSSKSFFRKVIRAITGYPELKVGAYYYCGMRGPQPLNGGRTQWFSGGAFLSRKDSLFSNFNLQMCDLFEAGLGMGEDVLLGYTLSKTGKVSYMSEMLFLHNDQGNSQFTTNLIDYGKRVAYSRLYLSLEYARLNKKELSKAFLYYTWHMLFRIMGMAINFLIKPTKSRSQLLVGSFLGWLKSFSLKYDATLAHNHHWSQQADKILNGRSA